MIEITQADREAADDAMVFCNDPRIVKQVARAFARHRIASQAEAHELLKEVLAGACVNYAYIAPRNIERIKKLVGEA